MTLRPAIATWTQSITIALVSLLIAGHLPAVAAPAPENFLKEAPARLTDADITQRLQTLPEPWTRDGQILRYTHTFADFVEAIAFVNRLVEPAEELGHHPDIAISYNRVSLAVTTHDADGLTDLDFHLAEKIVEIQ
ncbi:MAG: 4a-hydroxytetrahydrobiopterin dehydratase [Elainellaceae cyanobacterium]